MSEVPLYGGGGTVLEVCSTGHSAFCMTIPCAGLALCTLDNTHETPIPAGARICPHQGEGWRIQGLVYGR